MTDEIFRRLYTVNSEAHIKELRKTIKAAKDWLMEYYVPNGVDPGLIIDNAMDCLDGYGITVEKFKDKNLN